MIKGHGHRTKTVAKPQTWSDKLCPWCKMMMGYEEPVLCREKLVHPYCRKAMESETTRKRREALQKKEKELREARLRLVKKKNDAIREQKKQRAKEIHEYYDQRISEVALERFSRKSKAVGMLKAEQLAVWKGSQEIRDRYKKEIVDELMRAIDKILPVKGE